MGPECAKAADECFGIVWVDPKSIADGKMLVRGHTDTRSWRGAFVLTKRNASGQDAPCYRVGSQLLMQLEGEPCASAQFCDAGFLSALSSYADHNPHLMPRCVLRRSEDCLVTYTADTYVSTRDMPPSIERAQLREGWTFSQLPRYARLMCHFATSGLQQGWNLRSDLSAHL